MSSERQRRRAAELVQQIEDWQRRWLKDPRGTKKAAFNRIIQKEINPRRKELARLMRQYNFTRPGSRSKLVSRLLYGFSKLNQTNAEGMELRVHAIHGFAILLYCDGLLKAPNVRIDVACGKKWKAGREREKGSESTTNGRVSQSGSTKVSESGVAVGGGSGAGVGSIELVSLSMEQALW